MQPGDHIDIDATEYNQRVIFTFGSGHGYPAFVKFRKSRCINY
ncbi:hypothetical protein GDI3162 [Gluconacetobacter diazotrophicus PA1 5]|uniref:Uncharacterized protein n=1 Tax=Gluconacetobacter diazotrophicus (strain ATCC 49037 / DSM 5601 / CCUG 37298 / CIP 103539 / LMG 7603 / PAl5) TaxID=272568 RepID=A9H0C2_GLUDA|nr:hypothetical protein GDI3162 [Gluconacetobacter diazotrophicus PA1 5]